MTPGYYKPSTPAGVAYSSILIHHGFHPRLFKLKPFGLVSAILKFLCSTFWAATQGCPYMHSSPDPINREYQTLHAHRLSLRDRSPHLIFLPSHPLLFVLHSQFSTSFFHSQLSVLNSSLLTLHFLGSFRPIPSNRSFENSCADGDPSTSPNPGCRSFVA